MKFRPANLLVCLLVHTFILLKCDKIDFNKTKTKIIMSFFRHYYNIDLISCTFLFFLHYFISFYALNILYVAFLEELRF